MKRTVRLFSAGETVFSKLPSFVRPAKHLLGDRCSGPYDVVDQRSFQSALLRDPQTGELVDGGRNILLDQLLTGQRRSNLVFDEAPTEVRGIGEMLRGERAPVPNAAGALIRGAGRRKGVCSRLAAMWLMSQPPPALQKRSSRWVECFVASNRISEWWCSRAEEFGWVPGLCTA